jgi:hypothetical protein
MAAARPGRPGIIRAQILTRPVRIGFLSDMADRS